MRYRFQSGGKIYQVTIDRHGDVYRATVDGKPYEFEVLDSQPGILSVRFAGRPVMLYWAADGEDRWISAAGCSYRIEKPARNSHRRFGERILDATIHSPMPAQVRSVEIFEGDSVEHGQTLVVLEAMKMEIRVKSPRKGRIGQVFVKENQFVERDQELAEILDQDR